MSVHRMRGMEKNVCGYCGWTNDEPMRRPSWMRGWRAFTCTCGAYHHFCEICYRGLKERGIIVSRGQRGGGKKESLKACPKDLKVVDALMGP